MEEEKSVHRRMRNTIDPARDQQQRGDEILTSRRRPNFSTSQRPKIATMNA